MILAIRTDNQEAETGLFLHGEQKAYKKWLAHRELGVTIHKTIKELLDSVDNDWSDLTGIVFYKGPGSFTGLRIGASVANGLAYSNNIQVANTNGDDWISEGIKALDSGVHGLAIPEYGSEPHTTVPKK